MGEDVDNAAALEAAGNRAGDKGENMEEGEGAMKEAVTEEPMPDGKGAMLAVATEEPMTGKGTTKAAAMEEPTEAEDKDKAVVDKKASRRKWSPRRGSLVGPMGPSGRN
eukprot:GHVU01150296.1.p2 GENE.GHVU01150296.1~~GHVU01150296.1.p2  ORF type:complete len:122 (+),score=35.40 GHVU01150296.1:42-368(+)